MMTTEDNLRLDIVAEGGALQVAGNPSTSVSWAELAVASRDQSRLPEGLEASTQRHELDFDAPEFRDVEYANRQSPQPARGQRHRRVRNDRFDAGDSERRGRRPFPLGVVHIDMPCTPERVWSAIHAI